MALSSVCVSFSWLCNVAASTLPAANHAAAGRSLRSQYSISATTSQARPRVPTVASCTLAHAASPRGRAELSFQTTAAPWTSRCARCPLSRRLKHAHGPTCVLELVHFPRYKLQPLLSFIPKHPTVPDGWTMYTIALSPSP